ncbi:MAG: ABC transporter substrate-binding protein [Oscillospiraceae bacterium]|nr:ABC transporter substrate-binding protein [Oscillospiraceae bacterium]
MKKRMLGVVLALVLIAGVIALFVACGGANDNDPQTQDPTVPAAVARTRDVIEVTDFNDLTVELRQNPSVVAIYDNGILDMLYNVGFENTGIETLIIPNPAGLPDILSWYREQYELRGAGEINVINGGTLFYVDWDVLDIVTPELVILGARSFGMNAAGDRLSPEDNAQFRADTEERYADTTFIRLTIHVQEADLLNDMRFNANVLGQIWPDTAPLFASLINEVETEMAEIAAITSASDMEAVFVMMTTPDSFSVFLANSRKGFFFDEFGFNPLELDIAALTDQHGMDARAEFLLAHNPDVIFLLDRTEPETGNGAGAQAFMNDPMIQRTAAYENGHIYAGLPMAEWYTVVGGISSARRMIADVNRFIANYTAQ